MTAPTTPDAAAVAAREAAFVVWFDRDPDFLPHDWVIGFWRAGWADYSSPPARFASRARPAYLAGRRGRRAHERAQAASAAGEGRE